VRSREPRDQPAVDRKIAAALTIALATLLVHNLVLLTRNQLVFDHWHRLGVHDAPIDERARDSHNSDTTAKAGIYYVFRERMPGATVTIPPSLRNAVWWIERVGRVKVVVSDTPIPLAPADAAALRARASFSSHIRTTRREWPIAFVLADRAPRYVVAEASDGLIVLPEPMYTRPR